MAGCMKADWYPITRLPVQLNASEHQKTSRPGAGLLRPVDRHSRVILDLAVGSWLAVRWSGVGGAVLEGCSSPSTLSDLSGRRMWGDCLAVITSSNSTEPVSRD